MFDAGISRSLEKSSPKDRATGDGGSRPPVSASGVLRILSYLRPYLWHTVGILICIAVGSGISLVPPLLIRGLIDRALPEGDAALLGLLVVGMILAPAIAGLITVAQEYLNTVVGQAIMFDVRRQLFTHLQQMSLGFYTVTPTGQIMSRVNNDVAGVQQAVTGTLMNVTANLITLTLTIVVITQLNWKLALLSIVLVPLFVYPARRAGRFRRSVSRETQEQQASLTAYLQERLGIGGQLLMRVFGRLADEQQRFHALNAGLMRLQIRSAMVGRWFRLFVTVISAMGPALIFGYGGWLVLQGELTVGTLLAFVAFLAKLYQPAGQLANVYVDLQGAFAVFARIFEYLDQVPAVRDAPGALVLPAVRGRLQFEQVSFSYPPSVSVAHAANARTQPVLADTEPQRAMLRSANAGETLRDVSFDVEAGQLVALVGPSGAGKTTLTYLMPRFYDPDRGRILLDGHDLRDVTLQSLTQQFGIVLQETFLFHTTIRENLLYARPDATEQELVGAARAAAIHEFITRLPDGYDTMVGERGFRTLRR